MVFKIIKSPELAAILIILIGATWANISKGSPWDRGFQGPVAECAGDDCE